MARLITSGLESQLLTSAGTTTGEQSTWSVGTVAIDTAVPRSGAACAKCAAGGVNNMLEQSLTSVLGRAYYHRFAIRVSALPAATSAIFRAVDATGTVLEISLAKDGKLEAWNAVTATHPAGSIVIEPERWYVIETKVLVPAAGKGKVAWRVDGVLMSEEELSVRNTGLTRFRSGNIAGAAMAVYLDDLAVNDDQGASENSWPEPGRKIVMLRPSSDKSRTGWVGGEGSTEKLFEALDNTPAVGAVVGAATNTSQIKDSNNNSTDTYEANMAPYKAALAAGGGGLITADVVKLVAAQVRGGQNTATGRGLGLTMVSNPAAAEVTGFNLSEEAKAEPSGWRTNPTIAAGVVYNPDLDKAVGPVLKIRKSVATADTVMVDMLGLLVEYEPGTPQPAGDSTGKIYHGADMDGDVYAIGQGDAPYNPATWNSFEQSTGKPVGIVHYSDPWRTAAEGGLKWEGFGAGSRAAVDARGAISMITLGGPANVLEEVVAGTWDEAIDAWATKAAAFGKPMFLRLWHEMNGTWYSWGRSALYVEAWRRFYNRLNAIAKNVSMVWCPNVIYDAASAEFMVSMYPGDAYVDWVGMDGYSGTNPLKSYGWKTPVGVFGETYAKLQEIAPRRPIMIAETAASEFGGSKANWISELLGAALPIAMPKVRALVWFNWNIPSGEGRLDWPVESSAAAREAYREGIASPYYRAPEAALFPSGAKVPIPTDPAIPRVTKPPLELDVEVEDPSGNLYRWDPNSRLASKRPQNLNFSTQRGEGAGPGGVTLTRQVMKDYPDLGLLNTIRFIGKNGEVAYEGLIHDFARSNDPMQQFAVASIGWMATARLRKFREIYADRSLANWSGMSTTRRADVYSGGYNADAASMSVGPDDAGRPSLTASTTGKITKPFFEFTYDGLGAEIAILYIGAIARINLLDHGADAWTNLYPFGADDLAHAAEVLGGDISALSSYEFTPTSPKAVVGLTGHYDNPVAAGSEGAQYGFRIERPAAFGPHGLPLYGSAPEQGPVVSDVLAHIFDNFTPLTWDEDNPKTTYPVQQARFSGDYPIDAAKTLNDLHLWELGVFADRKVSYRPADLATYDWQVRTDDPGVRFNPLQGDSIDGFANGVEVTFTDFAGRTITLFPDDFAELRDETETNPANQWGIPLWKDFTVPYPTTLADALQMGRAYLAEYNRPKSPGTITIAGGYIMDGAEHWRQGWAVQCGQTIALTDHPNDAPRLITSTPSWDQDSKQLTISVDNGYQLLQAFLARQAVAREAANLT